MTYKSAGVDIDLGDELVERIKPFAARTRTQHVLSGVGGFAGLCAIPPGMKEPILVSGTDGVGTKLKLAFLTGQHDTIGEDLVAMCVNDVITSGATPLYFLDYYATGKLNVDVATQVIASIARGCELAECALLGGETAEMPGFYGDGEYDLAGFAVGVVEKAAIIDGKRVQPGMTVIGIASSGLHSNGYSLARRVLLEKAGYPLDIEMPDYNGRTLGNVLLTPTKIYVRAVKALLAATEVFALSHITGGGLVGNVPRVLPDGIGIRISRDALQTPRIFGLIQEHGNIEDVEMLRAFNMGIGLVAVVDKPDAALRALKELGEDARILGTTIASAAEFEGRVEFV